MPGSGADDPVVFEAVLTPHRSLSRRGVLIVIGFLLTASAGVTTLFWTLGAWPIAGFNGGEVLLATALLRAHARSRRTREVLRLTQSALTIERWTEKGGYQETTLQAFWLNVILEERAGRVPGLFLSSHGRSHEIARMLGEEQKRDLASALTDALRRLRNPVFENTQLGLQENPARA